MTEQPLAPPPPAPPRTVTVSLPTVLAVVLVTVAALAVFLLLNRVNVDGDQIEGPITDDLTQMFGEGVTVTCPDRVSGGKGKIIDCSAVLPSGRQAEVFVTLADTDGHFTFQVEPSAVAAEMQEKVRRDMQAGQ